MIYSDEIKAIIDINEYRKFFFVSDTEFDENVRKSTSTGRPLGTFDFFRKMESILARDIFTKKAGRPRTKGK